MATPARSYVVHAQAKHIQTHNQQHPDAQSFRVDETMKGVENYDQWNPQELVAFFHTAGLGGYSEVFLKHKISGRIAPLLTDENLKEMGVHIVGDRLRIMAVVHALGRKARYNKRSKVWWEGKEQLYFTELGKLFWTCCGLFPEDPSTYRLTSNHLRIKTVNPARIGPVKLCCCYQYSINNVDLSKVNDVDILGEPAPCCERVLCCAPGRERIEIVAPSEENGKLTLVVRNGDAEMVTGKILHQIEEAQLIERD